MSNKEGIIEGMCEFLRKQVLYTKRPKSDLGEERGKKRTSNDSVTDGMSQKCFRCQFQFA